MFWTNVFSIFWKNMRSKIQQRWQFRWKCGESKNFQYFPKSQEKSHESARARFVHLNFTTQKNLAHIQFINFSFPGLSESGEKTVLKIDSRQFISVPVIKESKSFIGAQSESLAWKIYCIPVIRKRERSSRHTRGRNEKRSERTRTFYGVYKKNSAATFATNEVEKKPNERQRKTENLTKREKARRDFFHFFFSSCRQSPDRIASCRSACLC